MSNKKRNTVFFLCAYCSIKIQSNINNLYRHEKSHKNELQKIKCSANNCESTFVNKNTYWLHWTRKHEDMVMPDILNYVIVTNKEKPVKRSKIVASEIESTFQKPNNFFLLNSLGLFENVDSSFEKKKNLFFTNEQFFGELK